MVAFALKTLISDRGKLLIAVAGVVFSYVLINIQGGLYFGLIDKASLLIDQCDADIWVGRHLVENVELAHHIPESRLSRIKGLPGVQAAEPFIVGKGMAVLPDGGFEDAWVIGSDSASMMGSARTFVEGSLHDLRRPDAVSVDEMDARKLGFPKVGDYLEINEHRARVVAKTRGKLGFLTTPYLFTTIDNARRFGNVPSGYCTYFLIDLKEGVSAPEMKRRIQAYLPNLEVFTADEFRHVSRDYWMKRTGIGVSFGTATLLGLFVGLLMVAQSLYSLALDHISDYATLKAIGAGEGCVLGIVATQAMLVAALGSIIGVVMVGALTRTLSSPIAPIEVSTALIYGGFVLVFLICSVATVLPYLRIRSVDPATVLQG